MPPQLINFQQVRGSWIAIAATDRDAKLVGHTRLPVIRDFENGDFAWSRVGVVVRGTPETSKDQKSPSWWMLDRNTEWRSLLGAAIPTLIRKGTGIDNGFGDNSVGRKIGLFVPALVTITLALLELRFERRLPFALS